jgi:peptide/nickel transport system substrate-binding protein
VENFTLYKENEAAGNYVVNLLPSFENGAVVYYFNQSHPDPAKAELFTNADFRRAMSVAINRDEINELVFQGLSKPIQFTITESASFYQSEWGEAWTQYDPDLANQMLDELGLTERNSAGIRLMSDGNPLTIVNEFVEGSFAGAATSVQELAKEYWAAVGVNLEAKVWGVGPWPVRLQSMEWDLHSNKQSNGEMYGTLLSEDTIGFLNEPWVIYRAARADVEAGRKTLADFEGGVLPGNEPPPEIDALLDVREDLQRTVYGSPEYTRLATAYYQQLADETYAIGTVGQTPLVFISRPNIGNLPEQFPPWIEWGGDLNHYSNQWFFRPD